jgi:uncharacterized protein YbaP (TraB family)
MKKAFLFVCLFSLIINQACKQTKRNQIFPLENSLLWEISGKGLKSPSYLFGTNHLVGKKFADSLSGIGEKFNMCKAIAGEFVIDTAALHKANPNMLSTYYPLSKIFTPVEFASIDRNLKQFSHFRLIDLNSAKPMFIELLILNGIAPKTISPVNPGLDEYFQDEGKKHGYKVIGLETLEFQSSLLFNTPIDIQKKNLLFLTENMDSTRKNLILLTRLYKEQDLRGIDRLISTLEEYSPEESDKMLKDRNLKWINEIPKIIHKQPTFIALGVAHLIREYGLINQLRLKGYTVKPLKI